MNCKNHKIRTKKGIKYGYCTLYKKEVDLFNCKCESIERKMHNNWSITVSKNNKMHNKSKNTMQKIKKRTYKLAKAEKNRSSIIYQDLNKCCVEECLTPYYNVERNEVFEGAYRQSSIKYNMVCSFCESHHRQFHSNREFALYYKVMFEEKFLKTHTLEEWLDIFKIDYRNRK